MTGVMDADPNALALPELFRVLSSEGDLPGLLARCRREDLGDPARDITSELATGSTEAMRALLVARAPGVVAGLEVIPALIETFGARTRLERVARDGEAAPAGAVLARLDGAARDILALERTMLNIVGRLSGVATRTAAFVRAAGSRVRLLDTRKTTPGLRHLEKYAVRCGGGWCHRVGLHDAVLVKDNHLASVALGDLGARVETIARRARASKPRPRFVEVEVDGLEQLDALLGLAPGVLDVILLDNFPPTALREAAARRDARAPGVLLEASGGVTLETVGEIGATGVDRISVGSLTHGAAWLDVALDVSPGDA